MDLKLPILLAPNNYTPLKRTPWAGSYISKQIKNELYPDEAGSKIGESWEFSCDPDFPSKIWRAEKTLIELGKELKIPFELLLKIINAADNLSLQVHPDDQSPYLKPLECGKPESWLIIDKEPGAGIYLGFKRHLAAYELRHLLDQGNILDELQFVPVAEGDYFEIPPGVAHAIGRGVSLVEPQQIHFEQSGKTYRLWDWDRRYDAHGTADPIHGTKRALHIEESIYAIDQEKRVGKDLLAALYKKPKINELTPGIEVHSYAPNSYYQTTKLNLSKNKKCLIQITGSYLVSLTLKGNLIALAPPGDEAIHLNKGFSALWLPGVKPMLITAQSDAQIIFVHPIETSLHISHS